MSSACGHTLAWCGKADNDHYPRSSAIVWRVTIEPDGHRASVPLLVEVVAERLGAGGVAQLGHGLGFDLSDALSGDPVDLADFIERAWLAVGEPVSQLHNAGLSLRERGQYRPQLIL